MQTNLEHVTSIIRTLPLEELEKLGELINEEKQAKREKSEKSVWRMERYKKARKWLDENSKDYLNQWVCLEGDRLIAYGSDALEVHKKAVEEGIDSPFVYHIVEEPKHYIGGW